MLLKYRRKFIDSFILNGSIHQAKVEAKKFSAKRYFSGFPSSPIYWSSPLLKRLISP
jgi:hypothetical protein